MVVKTTGGKLVVEAPIGDGTASKTGKSTIFVSTGGFIPVEGGYKLNLVLIKVK